MEKLEASFNKLYNLEDSFKFQTPLLRIIFGGFYQPSIEAIFGDYLISDYKLEEDEFGLRR